MKVSIQEKAKTITVVLPLEPEGTKSKSGASDIVATTRGNKVSDVLFNGKPITVGATLYVKNEG
jgi:hypothetical protein